MQKISPKMISNKIAVSRSSIKYPNKEEQKTPFNCLLGKNPVSGVWEIHKQKDNEEPKTSCFDQDLHSFTLPLFSKLVLCSNPDYRIRSENPWTSGTLCWLQPSLVKNGKNYDQGWWSSLSSSSLKNCIAAYSNSLVIINSSVTFSRIL